MAVLLGSVEDYREMYYNFISDEFGTYKDQAIAKLGRSFKTTSDSWRRFGSRGYLERPEFRAAYIDNKKGIPIDLIAESASESGLEISPEDVVNFMLRYPGGQGNRQSKSLKTFYGAHNPENVLPEYRKQFLKSLKAPKQKPVKVKAEPEKKKAQFVKYLPQRGESNEKKDMARFAMSPGKRISKSGKVYWETRKNRTDDFITGLVKL